MTRRVFLAVACASAARADAAGDAWALLGELTSALSSGNWSIAIDCFDPAMPGYEQLSADTAALVREAAPRSYIELISNEGDDRARTIVVDWTLSIESGQSGVASVRRQARVTLKMEKNGRHWRIDAFDPIKFFAPPA